MQALTKTALAALDSYQPVGLALQVGSAAEDAGEVRKAEYSAGSTSSSGAFPLGQAASAEAKVTVAGTGLALAGSDATLVYRCGGETYPLLTGRITEAEEQEEETQVYLYDALYVSGGKTYAPGTETGQSCTLRALLAELAAGLGVILEDETASRAASVTLTEGTAPLDGETLQTAAGAAAALLGGNAVITRAGELAVYTTAVADFSAECYADGADREAEFTLTGLRLTRTVTQTGTDGDYTTRSTETVEFLAGDETGAVITAENPLATQALAEGALDALAGLRFSPGSYDLQGGVQLEPGDIVTLDGATVAIAGVSLTLDGGCRCAVTSLGLGQSGAGSNVERALSAVTAELQEVEYLTAETVHVTNAAIESLRADTVRTEALSAVTADIDTLTADVANINTVLAGSVGTGNLQAIHITGDNVVIDDATVTDAMIASLAADKLTAGTIYTSLIKIASDKDENLLLDSATLQIKDANGTVRVQLGKDASGDYSYYLWDAAGTLLWSPTGITEGGVPDGIIRNDMVAEDAAIAGSKLDITSVAERLNEDGSLSVDAGQVTIDGTKLDVAYKTVTESAAKAQTAADNAQSAADAAQSDAASALSKTSTLETNLSVVQGQIESKVWQSDITEATDALGTRVTTVEDQYSTLSQTTDGLSVSVGKLETAVENIGGRNLLRLTKTFGSPQWAASDSTYVTISTDEAGYGVVCLGTSSSTTTTITVRAVAHTTDTGGVNIPWSEVCDKELTMSLELKSDGAYVASYGVRFAVEAYVQTDDAMTQYYTANIGASGTAGELFYPSDISSDWQKFSVTFTPTASGVLYNGTTKAWTKKSSATGDFEADGINAFVVRIYNRGNPTTQNLYLRKPKLEYGSVTTDWTPAPEDATTDLEAAKSELTEQITDQSTQILATAENIVLEATQTMVTKSEYEDYKTEASNTITTTADSLKIEIASVQAEIVGDVTAQIEEATSTSITYNADGNLDLYAVNVRFVDEGGNPISYWDGDTLHTGNIYVDTTERAQFGNFAFQPRSDGSLVFLKVGG